MSSPTLADVAKEAEVSASTVSLVINQRKGVRPDTRKRVFEVIDELGYQPQRSRMDQATPLHVALIYPLVATTPEGMACGLDKRGLEMIREGDVVKPAGMLAYRAKAVQVIRRELKRQGHTFSLLAGAEHVDYDPVFKQMVREGDIDGAIFIRLVEIDGYMDYLLEQQVPTVLTFQYQPHSLFSSIGLDNHRAGAEVARFYARRGHRNIGVVEMGSQRRIMADRVKGFVQTAQEQDLNAISVDTGSASFEDNPEGFRKAARQLLDANVTGVFGVIDNVGVGIVNALNELDVDVPRDVEVIGVDDLDRRTERGQRVSSIGYEVEPIGQLAIQSLLQLINVRNETDRISIGTRPKFRLHDTTRSRRIRNT